MLDDLDAGFGHKKSSNRLINNRAAIRPDRFTDNDDFFRDDGHLDPKFDRRPASPGGKTLNRDKESKIYCQLTKSRFLDSKTLGQPGPEQKPYGDQKDP